MGDWKYDRAMDHIDARLKDVENVEIVDYKRDMSLDSIPTNKAYRMDAVHLYADIVNLEDMLNSTTVEGETCHKRTLRFLNLHYRAVHRILRKCGARRVDFHNQRLHGVVSKPYATAFEKERVQRTVAMAQLITRHVSDRITRRLRRLIGTDHANDGEDIIVEAHGRLMTAVFDPDSADGGELAQHFWPRVRNRGIDAARAEGTYARRHVPLGTDAEGEPILPRGSRVDGGMNPAEMSHLLGRIEDPRKRLAFRLYAEGMRVRKGDVCVASVLGCDPKTAAAWIAEARAILAAEIGA